MGKSLEINSACLRQLLKVGPHPKANLRKAYTERSHAGAGRRQVLDVLSCHLVLSHTINNV